MEYIVLETDSPYLSPEPYRGSRNEPRNIKIIMEKICNIRGIEYNELSRIVQFNVVRLFDKYLNL